MRSPHNRLSTVSLGVPRWVTARGFSMVELLVTIVIAGIVFAAMVPFFANALNRTSEDELRVDSTNIAQDRIEQVRLLDYAVITDASLNTTSTSFGDGRFGPTYTLVGESRPYTITYEVTPPSESDVPQKLVTVRVSRPGSSYVTTADTIVQNPAAGNSSVSDSEPTDLTMTVYFDNWTYVDSTGVTIRRVRTVDSIPVATTTPTPTSQRPTSTNREVTWTGLTGGPNYTYTIMCESSKANYTLTAPPFRMWTSGRLKFDTYPGGD
jgi:prepilin-type N-terminal cleavage/methylation domain-containing protein